MTYDPPVTPDDDVRTLLTEIRDVQRDHLAEYRRVTRELMELQNRALERQQQIGALYRRVVFAGGTLFVLLVALLVYLLVRWGGLLFRR